MARKSKDLEESVEEKIVEEEVEEASSEIGTDTSPDTGTPTLPDTGTSVSEPSVTPEPAPIPTPPAPPADWGRITERPVMSPPPSLPPPPPVPVMDSAPQSNPVIVAEATKPEPEQEAASEWQGSETRKEPVTGRRVQRPGIIGHVVRGGTRPGRPG